MYIRITRLLAVVMLLASVTHAENWPQWRGPNRNGAVAHFQEPTSWPETLKLLEKLGSKNNHKCVSC